MPQSRTLQEVIERNGMTLCAIRGFESHMQTLHLTTRGLRGLMMVFTFVAGCSMFWSPVPKAAAADEKATAALVAAIPTAVPQVLTSGIWEDQGDQGVYRVVVVNSVAADKSFRTQIFVQWLKSQKDQSALAVRSTVEVKEAVSQDLKDAFVFMDAEEKNAALLIISSFDEKAEQDRQLWVKLTTPGSYEIVPAVEVRGSDIGSDGEPTGN